MCIFSGAPPLHVPFLLKKAKDKGKARLLSTCMLAFTRKARLQTEICIHSKTLIETCVGKMHDMADQGTKGTLSPASRR